MKRGSGCLGSPALRLDVHGVTLRDRREDATPAFFGRQLMKLDGSRLRGEVTIFDTAVEPVGVVAFLQMVKPGVLVDAFRHLDEDRQVFGAEVQPALRTLKVEALVFTEASDDIF